MRNFKKQWLFPDLIDIPGNFQASIGGFRLVSETLFRRGLTTLEAAQGFLNPDKYQPSPPTQLPGLDTAVTRILAALDSSETILVWGDFDVDGQTSTTLLKSALSDLRGHLEHYIPNRDLESHGISLESLSTKISQLNPSLIITCDTGIDASESVAYANSKGIDVIITDHHQLPENLPDALAIINPAFLPPTHPLTSLPGVGVAYKLIEEIYNRFNLSADHLLDLVALGIVADVAQLSGDTRFLLQRGLPVLRSTDRLGLTQLFTNAQLDPSGINEDQIGYTIGPRLNALGRLADANSCVTFFTSSDPKIINDLANQLETLNSRRQELTENIFIESIELIDTFPELNEDFPILVLQGPPHWNPGVIGIVASRLVDRYQKPVIMLTQDNGISRGSARSIPGVPISELINLTGSLLLSYGGHPMAAGLSLMTDNVSLFRRNLADHYAQLIGDILPPPEVIIDAELPFQMISPDYIEDFKRLAPFGAGNPKLLFSTRNVSLRDDIDDKTIGKNGNHRKLTLTDSSGSKQEFLWWNSQGINLPDGDFDIVYSLDLSTYRGRTRVQSTLRHVRESTGFPVYLKNTAGPETVDFRTSIDPFNNIREIIDTGKTPLIWAESSFPEGYQCYPRKSLFPSSSLIIWTVPPSPVVLKTAIDLVAPNKIFFFGIQPDIHTLKSFRTALLGLLKHIEFTGKIYNPDLFAQRIALTSTIIEAGLEWLHFHGDIDLSSIRTANKFKSGDRKIQPEFIQADKKIKLLLGEVLSYRSYYKKADINTLL